METVKKCTKIADRLKVSTSQIALAWLMTKGDDICMIPGTTKLKNLESNMLSAQIALQLTPEDIKLLDEIKPFTGMR